MQNDGNLVMSWKPNASDIFSPLWDTKTIFPKEFDYSLVVEDCNMPIPSVAIYRGDPTTGVATRIYVEDFSLCPGQMMMPNGDRSLQGTVGFEW